MSRARTCCGFGSGPVRLLGRLVLVAVAACLGGCTFLQNEFFYVDRGPRPSRARTSVPGPQVERAGGPWLLWRTSVSIASPNAPPRTDGS